MAIYNEILAGRFARGIQKIFSMKGGVPTRQLSGEVMATFQIDKSTALENRSIHSVRSFAYPARVTGGVAQLAAVRFRNPTGSNVVAILEKFLITGTTTDTIRATRGATGTGDLTTNDSANQCIRDLRLGPVSGAIITSFRTNYVQQAVRWIEVDVAINQNYDVIQKPSDEFVIAPGDLVTIQSTTAAAILDVTVFWRERTLEESELSA